MPILDSVIERSAALISAPGRALAARSYRESIFSGEYDENVAAAARRIRSEWDQDRAVYVARVEARRILEDDFPKLTAASEKAAADLAEFVQFLRGVIPAELTIGQLRERIQQVAPRARVGTPAELAAGLAHVAGQLFHSPIGKLKGAAMNAKHAAADAKRRAEQVLCTTSAKIPNDETTAIQNDIRGHEAEITQCDRILHAAAQVPMLTQLIEKASRGEVTPAMISMNSRGSGGEIIGDGEVYRELRNRLDRAQQVAQDAPAAEAKKAKHLAAIADLQAKLQAAQDEWLRRLSEPRNMKFLGDN